MTNILNLFHSLFLAYPFLIIIASFIIGFIAMPYVLRVSIRKQMVVKPNKRTSHKGNIPNVGGINIFTSFIISYLLLTVSGMLDSSRFLLAGMYLIFIVGFFDDLIAFSPKKKLIGELVAGFILIIIADVRLTDLQGFLGIGQVSVWISYAVSFFLFLLIINSLNLIDGVDGLATGIGMLICAFFGIYFQLVAHSLNRQEVLDLSIMAYSLIGSLAIFFIYNVFGKRSKIFMGDSGALVLGYIVYILVIRFCEINRTPPISEYYVRCSPAVAVCVLAVPLFDTLRVMMTRIKKRISPFKPDKNHMHHLLLSIGLKHRQVTFVLVSVNLSFIVLGLIGHGWKNSILVLSAVALAAIYTLILWTVVDKHNKKLQKSEIV